jgi:ketosteroid isomerase-like protein
MSPQSKRQETETMKPEDLNDRFGDAYNAGDLESMLSLYEADAILDFGPAGLAQGAAAIRAALAPFMALGGQISYERRFCLVCGDLALISIEYTLKGGKAPDGALVEMNGATVELARRQADGTWKYVIDLPNGALPNARAPRTTADA